MSTIESTWQEIKDLQLITDEEFGIFQAVLYIFWRTRRTMPSIDKGQGGEKERLRHLLDIPCICALFSPIELESETFTPRFEQMIDKLCFLWTVCPCHVGLEGREIYNSYVAILCSGHHSLALKLGNELKRETFFRSIAQEAEAEVRKRCLRLPKPLVKFELPEWSSIDGSISSTIDPLEPQGSPLTTSDSADFIDQTLEAGDWEGWHKTTAAHLKGKAPERMREPHGP